MLKGSNCCVISRVKDFNVGVQERTFVPIISQSSEKILIEVNLQLKLVGMMKVVHNFIYF